MYLLDSSIYGVRLHGRHEDIGEKLFGPTETTQTVIKYIIFWKIITGHRCGYLSYKYIILSSNVYEDCSRSTYRIRKR